ncbi:MAG: bifunctional phosphopantothenoylcysteine decarboxylase/phosphopantothenate--cysteine ligase CoaBC [Candidatus Omnitrophica bacterium]|nr:bifunctional phosphopantothenoylcysteine decarboxylase/phosphopantothenate--cysteine ligase CoaBC [Candidatus Omnitrophota bacterium]
MKPKHIVLGVTGSIAAYKAGDIIRRLQDNGCEVSVIMTDGAQKFITPLTLEVLSKKPVAVSMFERDSEWDMAHISLARWADLYLIAPATANVIGKFANGVSDDLLTCTAITTKAPIVIAPAMNTDMYTNAIVQDNITKLKKHGVTFIEPKEGKLACGDLGKGALADVDEIVKVVIGLLK